MDVSKYVVEKMNSWWMYNSYFRDVRIDLIYNYKDINVRNNNYVLLYDVDANIKYGDIGAKNIFGEYTISIDIRTGNYDDYVKIRDNVLAFLRWFGREENFYGAVDSNWTVYGFNVLRMRELSDKMRKMWRMVIDVRLLIHYGYHPLGEEKKYMVDEFVMGENITFESLVSNEVEWFSDGIYIYNEGYGDEFKVRELIEFENGGG